jgi:beta-galactosidase
MKLRGDKRRKPPAFRFHLEQLEERLVMAVGDLYGVPADARISINENAAWKFALNPSGTPQSVGYNDSSWSAVSLPYTWDGAAGTQNPPTGPGWYRKSIDLTNDLVGKELLLQFEGGYLVTSLYIDGVQIDYNPSLAGIDSHNGGWSSFTFDVTNQLSAGTHLLAVQVNNTSQANISPGNTGNTGDYTHEGGLYRDVSLIALNKTHVALWESATDVPPNTSPASVPTNTPITTPGVYFATTSNVAIGAPSAAIQVKTILDNQTATPRALSVKNLLVDASGIIQSEQIATQPINAGQMSVPVTQNSTVANPHLWDGRIDPYLYDLYVEVRDADTGQLLDVTHQRVGIHSFKINAQPNRTDSDPTNDAAFMLNGHPYELVGVNMHQDSGAPGQLNMPAGWAQTDAQIRSDVDLALNLGATVIRTSHYPENQAFYDYCDQAGMLVYTEVGLQQNATSTTPNTAFVNNLDDQLTEMIKQNYNHSSILAWGLFNETGTSNGTLIQNLHNLAKLLDSTRYTGAASNQGSPTDLINAAPDLVGRHFYDGWYSSVPENMSAALDSFHNGNLSHPMAVTEFGAGSSPYQYSNNLIVTVPNTTDRFHPVNVQSQIEERQWAQLASKNYLWSKIVWQMFDATSPGKNEGDTVGVNDKGIVSRDRTTKKDTYYFYRANWNDPARAWANERTLYISDHAWTDRSATSAPFTVYSNLGAPTLAINGVSQGSLVPLVIQGVTIPNTYTTPGFGTATNNQGSINLAAGANTIQVAKLYAGQTTTDSVGWTYHASGLAGTPLARIDFTNNTANLQSGYNADTGAAFNGTFGWTNPTTHVPSANTAGTYNRTTPTASPFDQIKARTGIMLPTTQVWEYALPNGLYDVHIVAADSASTRSNSPMVNNLLLENITLHDVDFADTGDNQVDEFFAQVRVTDGRLTISSAPGTFSPRLAYVDINVLDNSPPAVIGSVFQATNPQQLQIQFGENVGTSLQASDLQLLNQTTGQTIASATISVSFNAATNTATFTFPGLAGSRLPVGNYVATIQAADVTDAAGNPLSMNWNTTISQTVGDLNLDGLRDGLDVPPMLRMLTDIQTFASTHGLSQSQLLLLADIDGSATITNADIQALLNLLSNGAAATTSKQSVEVVASHDIPKSVAAIPMPMPAPSTVDGKSRTMTQLGPRPKSSTVPAPALADIISSAQESIVGPLFLRFAARQPATKLTELRIDYALRQVETIDGLLSEWRYR